MIRFIIHGSGEKLIDKRVENRRYVRLWLFFVFLFLIAIVLVGGITRMLGAGLSITEWKPIHGVIPPSGHDQWQEEFEKYQKIAQYQQLNPKMILAEFKNIFWWEWIHRLLARFVGFFIALPLIFFWLTGRLEEVVKWRLIGILLLGCLQGTIGWWMVASGLDNSQLVSVSQYRLAIHLLVGCVIIIAVLALIHRLTEHTEQPASHNIQRFSGWFVLLVLFQIYLGALVAGLHVERDLMTNHFILDDFLRFQPIWSNLFENAMTVQFVHRFLACFMIVVSAVHALNVKKNAPKTTHARRGMLLLTLIMVQTAVGIVTLWLRVPLACGLIHQFLALVVLSFSVMHWIATKGAFPLSSGISTINSGFKH